MPRFTQNDTDDTDIVAPETDATDKSEDVASESPVVSAPEEDDTAHVEPATVIQEIPAQPVPIVATPELPKEAPTSDLYDIKKNVNGVSFSTNSISTPIRTFTPEDHGADFASIAQEFFATHQANIIAITYL